MTSPRRMHLPLWVPLLVIAGFLPPLQAVAQQRVGWEIQRTPFGVVLDFHPDGAWRVEARQVAAYRQRLLAQGAVRALNAPAAAGVAAPSPAAVSGIRKVPAILFRFSDVGTGAANDTSVYTQVLFGSPPPTGRPYSVRTFYEQMSNGLLSIQGQVVGWLTLPGTEITYTGNPSTDGCSGNPFGTNSCNGLFSTTAYNKMLAGLDSALARVDNGTFDWSQFDGNGDGIVDMVFFVHSEGDGACGSQVSTPNNHLWSHRGNGLNYTTKTPWPGHMGQFIRIRDYTLQSGVGGPTACNTSQVMPIGTTTHETGHAFGLPDLYDTGGSTEGIGEWGLMGSGNYSSPFSPSRMEAWSLSQLGWVVIQPLTTNGTYSFGPAPTSDTAFMVRVQGANPRGEYYLLENRQAALADTALIRLHCAVSGLTYPITCHGGLAIWHVDSTKVTTTGFTSTNTVNVGSPQGVLLAQADGRGDLQKTSGGNRGDAGDLWPGYGAGTPNTVYSFNTNPAALKNSDGTFVGFQVDSIRQLVPDGAMSFRLQFGGLTIVRAADTLAKVRVDTTYYHRFAGLFAPGSMHTISMDSAQTTSDGKTQYLWVSWSDAGARTHTVTGQLAGDSIRATDSTLYKLQVTTSGNGTVASSPPVDHATGVFLSKNTAETLTATAAMGSLFDRWTGDTTTTANPLSLAMTRPFVLTATFAGVLAITSGAPPGPVMGKGYSFTLTASGGNGTDSWQVTTGALPTGLSLASGTGVISGTPTQAGSFSTAVRVTSGAQTADTTLNLTVTEPALALADVLGKLFGGASALTADDLHYLDLLGNNNGGFDLGDFLAWVNHTNVSPTSPAVAQAIRSAAAGKVTP